MNIVLVHISDAWGSLLGSPGKAPGADTVRLAGERAAALLPGYVAAVSQGFDRVLLVMDGADGWRKLLDPTHSEARDRWPAAAWAPLPMAVAAAFEPHVGSIVVPPLYPAGTMLDLGEDATGDGRDLLDIGGKRPAARDVIATVAAWWQFSDHSPHRLRPGTRRLRIVSSRKSLCCLADEAAGIELVRSVTPPGKLAEWTYAVSHPSELAAEVGAGVAQWKALELLGTWERQRTGAKRSSLGEETAKKLIERHGEALTCCLLAVEPGDMAGVSTPAQAVLRAGAAHGGAMVLRALAIHELKDNVAIDVGAMLRQEEGDDERARADERRPEGSAVALPGARNGRSDGRPLRDLRGGADERTPDGSGDRDEGVHPDDAGSGAMDARRADERAVIEPVAAPREPPAPREAAPPPAAPCVFPATMAEKGLAAMLDSGFIHETARPGWYALGSPEQRHALPRELPAPSAAEAPPRGAQAPPSSTATPPSPAREDRSAMSDSHHTDTREHDDGFDHNGEERHRRPSTALARIGDTPDRFELVPVPREADDTSIVARAIISAQAKFYAVVKGRRADAGPKKYSYASLADVCRETLPQLNEEGVFPSWRVAGARMFFRLTHAESGQWMESDLPFVPPTRGADVQALGSMLSYLRRYLYVMMLGIVPIDDPDDDAAKAMGASRMDEQLVRFVLDCAEGRLDKSTPPRPLTRADLVASMKRNKEPVEVQAAALRLFDERTPRAAAGAA